MSKWQQVKLGDIGKIITGKTPPTANPGNYGGNIPFITPSDMYGWRDIFCTERYLTEQGVHTVKNNVIPSGAVCVSCIGSDMGKVVIARKRCVTNQQINSIIVNDNFDQHFVYYLLLTQKDVIRSLGKNGTAIPILNKSKFSEIKVSVPPIEEQRKIADVLSAYDDLIENNRKQIKLLEEAAQRLYKEWFIDLRFPGHENTPIVNGIPEGWEMNSLSSIIKLRSGFAFKSKDFCADGNFKIVTIKNVQNGVFDAKNTDAIAEIPANMPKHCVLSNGDILLSLTGNIGRVCFVVGQNFLLNQRVAKIESQYHCFAYCLFRNKDFCDTLNNLANGAAQQNLSPVRTEQMSVLIPPASLLSKFEKTASLFFKKLQLLYESNNNLQKTRNKILPKLMTGELEVK